MLYVLYYAQHNLTYLQIKDKEKKNYYYYIRQEIMTSGNFSKLKNNNCMYKYRDNLTRLFLFLRRLMTFKIFPIFFFLQIKKTSSIIFTR